MEINNPQPNTVIDRVKDTPTKESVLAVIDFEINQIISEQQRNGWTTWALLGVIVSSLWLLLDQLEKGYVDIFNSVLLFLIFSIIEDIIHHVRRLFPYSLSRKQSTLRFISISERENSLGFFLYALRFVVLFVLALFFAERVSTIQAGIVLLFYFVFSMISIFTFIMYYVPNFEVLDYFNNKISRKKYYFFWLIVIVALIWGMLGYLDFVFKYYPDGISIVDFRVAGFITIIFFVSSLLANHSNKNPILSALIEIRRELSFGRLPLETAVRKSEIVIAGIPVEERLQEHIRAILPTIEKRKLEFNRIVKKITDLSKEIPKRDVDMTEEHKRKAKEVLLPCSVELKKFLEKTQEEEKLEKRLRLHILMVENVSPKSVEAANDVLKKIEELDAELGNEAEEMLKDFLPMLERLKNPKEHL